MLVTDGGVTALGGLRIEQAGQHLFDGEHDLPSVVLQAVGLFDAVQTFRDDPADDQQRSHRRGGCDPGQPAEATGRQAVEYEAQGQQGEAERRVAGHVAVRREVIESLHVEQVTEDRQQSQETHQGRGVVAQAVAPAAAVGGKGDAAQGQASGRGSGHASRGFASGAMEVDDQGVQPQIEVEYFLDGLSEAEEPQYQAKPACTPLQGRAAVGAAEQCKPGQHEAGRGVGLHRCQPRAQRPYDRDVQDPADENADAEEYDACGENADDARQLAFGDRIFGAGQ